MDKTFSKELTFIKPVYRETLVSDTCDGWDNKSQVKKMAHFYELDALNRDQHKYHFRIIGFYSNAEKKDGFGTQAAQITMPTDEMYDMTVEFLKKFCLLNPEGFNETDRELFLNDFSAISAFALWLFREKVYPFFVEVSPNLLK